MTSFCNFQHVMLLMLAAGHQFEIFQAIILRIAIDVMNHLKKSQYASKMLLHKISMQVSAPSFNCDLKIAQALRPHSAHGSAVLKIAGLGAKPLSKAAEFFAEHNATKGARHINLAVARPASAAERGRIARVRAEARLMRAAAIYSKIRTACFAFYIHGPSINTQMGCHAK